MSTPPENYGQLLESPCPACGAKLVYSAEKESLSCGHCGYSEAPDRSADRIVEQTLAPFLEQAGTFTPSDTGQQTYVCSGCGAQTLIEARSVKMVCGFCGSPRVNESALEHTFIQPQGMLPFQISRLEAEEAFKGWIKKGWFRPNTLKSLSKTDVLHGIYLPFWTYDAQTQSDWEGYAGFYYYVTQTVTVNGKTQTRSVRHTRWEYRSGHLGHFFDDLLVCGSEAHAAERIQGVLPYDLSRTINFDPRLLLGWETEVYDVEVDKGYGKAVRTMEASLREMCGRELGGDTQRGLKIQTEFSGQSFKLLLAPLWICTYVYSGKTYRFLVNGQTGKIDGNKPVSWIKVALFVLFLVALGLLVYWFVEQSQHPK
jgi:ribosomal protein S27AE